MTEEWKHDLKKIAHIMRALIAAIDKLFVDVEQKKGEENAEDNT